MDILGVPKFAAAGWLKDFRDRRTQAQLSKFVK
jgi:hypothetical protein